MNSPTKQVVESPSSVETRIQHGKEKEKDRKRAEDHKKNSVREKEKERQMLRKVANECGCKFFALSCVSTHY
jgi:hypothetical protein